MYGFFSLWKCGVFLSFPILIELIYLFSFGHLVADGLIIVIRLPCLPSTSSLLSSDLSKCGIVSQNGRTAFWGPRWPWGTDLGQDHKRKQRCDCGCCALWSVMHESLPQVPLRLAGRGGAGGVGGQWFLFSHFDWHHLGPPVWPLVGRHWIIDMGPCHSHRDSQLLLSCHFPRIYFPDLESLDHSTMHTYFQVQKFWLIWTVTEIYIGKCIGATTCLEITDLHSIFTCKPSFT